MELEQKKTIALFRFGVIADLVARKDLQHGEREQLIRQLAARQWQIPFSSKSSISRSTIRGWLRRYRNSGERLESLFPRDREDEGRSRSIDPETELALANLRRELKAASLPVLLRLARERKILPAGFSASPQSIYRMFKRHGLDRERVLPQDRRRFESEFPNDLWQADCMHGPKVVVEGKLRKSYLFACIDDHSRLIPQARFYLRETVECFQDCLLQALEKRGLPRKLYVDNGPAFRSQRLGYACASLGIALLFATPYTPEGKGKIERWFKTLQTQLLPVLPESCTLEELNRRLQQWIDQEYHQRVHASTAQKPLQRYLSHLELLRPAPKDLRDHFRLPVRRKVDKDRTVSLDGRSYEAPLGLIGQTVTLLVHPQDMSRIEVVHDNRSWGFLVPLNLQVNSRIRRISGRQTELDPAPQSEEAPAEKSAAYREGELFGEAR
jgi:putative transposase